MDRYWETLNTRDGCKDLEKVVKVEVPEICDLVPSMRGKDVLEIGAHTPYGYKNKL